MSDNELDSLFKEAADGFKPPQDPSAWQGMSAKLDEAATGTSATLWNWKSITSLAVVGVTSVALIWYFSTGDASADKMLSEQAAESKLPPALETQRTEENSVSKANDNKDVAPSGEQKPSNAEIKSDNQIAHRTDASDSQSKTSGQAIKGSAQKRLSQDKPALTAEKDVKNDQTGSSTISVQDNFKTSGTVPNGKARSNDVTAKINAPSVIAAQKPGAENNRNKEVTKLEPEKEATTNSPVSVSETGVKKSTATDTPFTASQAKSSDQEKVTGETKTGQPTLIGINRNDQKNSSEKMFLTDSLQDEEKKVSAKDSTEAPVTSEEEKNESEKKTSDGKAFSVKLALSPDFSSIKFFDADKPGLNYGILIGYNFDKRWSVYTGAISSRKIYSSNDINTPYTNSGGYDYPVEKLDGDCRVLDIPINVYYTFFSDRSFSLKAGIGLSTYIMMSEDYVYHVDNPYGSDVYDQSIRNENNEWFKVMNVSVTLQKKINNRFYLEFEPFLKAPLAGVGEGEVSLVSLGAFLNLRFDFPIRKHE